MVLELNSDNFAAEINNAKPIIVDFWASWCGPCKALAPTFEKVEKEYEGKLRFANLNAELYSEIASDHGVRGIPCLVLFIAGKEVGRIIGNLSETDLKEKINEVLKKYNPLK